MNGLTYEPDTGRTLFNELAAIIKSAQMIKPHLIMYLGYDGTVDSLIQIGEHDIFPTQKVIDQILPLIPRALAVSDYSFRVDTEKFIYMFERYPHPDGTIILTGILLDRNFVNRTRMLDMQSNYYAGHAI